MTCEDLLKSACVRFQASCGARSWLPCSGECLQSLPWCVSVLGLEMGQVQVAGRLLWWTRRVGTSCAPIALESRRCCRATCSSSVTKAIHLTWWIPRKWRRHSFWRPRRRAPRFGARKTSFREALAPLLEAKEGESSRFPCQVWCRERLIWVRSQGGP